MNRPLPIKIVPTDEACQNFGELIQQVSGRNSRVIVETDGVPVIAFVAVPDLERWIRLDQERAERLKVLDEIRARDGDKTPGEVERDVAWELAAIRQEKRARHAS